MGLVRPRMVYASTRNGNGRDRVLEDQLLEVARLENYRELVETADLARQFDAAHQIDGDVDPILAKIVQESILNIL